MTIVLKFLTMSEALLISIVIRNDNVSIVFIDIHRYCIVMCLKSVLVLVVVSHLC